MTDQPTIHPERERLEPLQVKLLKVDSDPIDVGLAVNHHRNPDGPEAWREIEHLIDRLVKAEAALEPTEERIERVANF